MEGRRAHTRPWSLLPQEADDIYDGQWPVCAKFGRERVQRGAQPNDGLETLLSHILSSRVRHCDALHP
jgi:hypothetical protein